MPECQQATLRIYLSSSLSEFLTQHHFVNASPAAFPDGLRSRFRDGGEHPQMNGVEAALKPHSTNEVKAASRRSDHFEYGRRPMEAWVAHRRVRSG